MTPFSFMMANYVARQLGYRMTEGWMQGERATQAYFRPLATYAERLDELLAEIQALGFAYVDIWQAHLHYLWATSDHIAIARDLLARRDLTPVTLAGGFGGSRTDFLAVCKLAAALGVRILGGTTPLVETDRRFVVAALREYGLQLGYENHPEKTPAILLAKIGAGDRDVIGVTVDTGWFSTQGYDAAQAIRELGPAIFHVHLKDVLRVGEHRTCRFGQGVTPLAASLAALHDLGYTGAISIEHEPDDADPLPDLIASYALVKGWEKE